MRYIDFNSSSYSKMAEEIARELDSIDDHLENIEKGNNKPYTFGQVQPGFMLRLSVKKYRTLSKQDRALKCRLDNAFNGIITDRDVPLNCILKEIEERCQIVEKLYPDGNGFLVKDLGDSIFVSNKNSHVFKKVCRIDLGTVFYMTKEEWV